MNKRLVSTILCIVLLLTLALPVYATDTGEQEQTVLVECTISTAEEFLAFAENCRLDGYSRNLLVFLEKDIDLSGTEFESIPIFSGIFEGNGHTVSGLCITADGSAQGLFRYLTATAVVQNLAVQGDVHPGGSRNEIGGIAGRNAGTIFDCRFSGTVSGGDNVGGIVGSNAVTGIIENCHVDGEVHGNHFVGGIAGENNGVIRNCVNSAQVNTTAQQNSVELSDITMDTLTNSESANTVTDIGGIAGSSSSVIRGCENHGNVGYQHMGYNIGGIAGTQSGYIVECENFGNIQGRKEVGGIVGQMEPVSLIEYTEDTLQILQGQLGAMSGLVNQASTNAQNNAGQISSQIGVLQDQARTARDAVDTLFPDADNPELPDMDTVLAAQNTLSSAISAMPGTVNSIATAAETTVSGISHDLQAISGQIGAMSATINNASETLGGSITDVSDQDTAEILTGKVENCTNYGAVLADLNAGGIAGAMAMENDLDILEDWEQSGEESLNFESEVRAVILNCENHGSLTGKKQNAGGIVGWQSMGLVKNCANTGTLDGSGADYVGGISGLSTGFIRSNYAKCKISGSAWVGGIAGSGTIVTDSLALVVITEGSEKLGAILGYAEDSNTEEENPISANYYLPISEDIGAIDGISYSAMAEPLHLAGFLALENLPDLFRNVTVRFLFEDGTAKELKVALGEAFPVSQIPALSGKDGYTGAWENLAETDLSNMLFDVTFDAVYTAHHATIQSGEVSESGLPILLVQGSFTEAASVSVSESDTAPALSEREALVGNWTFALSETDHVTSARILVTDGLEADGLKLMICSEDGQWQEREYTADGSYLVFALRGEDAQIAIVRADTTNWLWIAAGAVLLPLALLLMHRKRAKGKKKDNPVTENQA